MLIFYSIVIHIIFYINILWTMLAAHTVQFWFWLICLCRFAPQVVLVSQITLMHCNFQNLSQIISWTQIRVLTGPLLNIHLFVLKLFRCKFESAFGILFLLKFAPLIPTSIKQNAWSLVISPSSIYSESE